MANSPEGEPSDADIKGNLVGLALSGGGIRSASFNLGLLQAFHRVGLLRHVDYLSTVSGGSYIGGWLANEMQQLNAAVGPDNLPLRKHSDGKEDPGITRLIQAGYYLRHPLLLANRYCFGLLKTNLILGSVVLLGCAVVAFTWRLLDQPPFCETILVLTGGVLIEAFRPFMVAFILLLSWLIAWLMAAPKRERFSGPVAVVVLVGLAALTFGLPLLEWFFEDVYLHPENLIWKLLRPLPLLLLVAWLLAWAIMTPVGKGTRSTGQPAVPQRQPGTLFGSPDQVNGQQGSRAGRLGWLARLSFTWKLYFIGLAGIAGFWMCWYFLEALLNLTPEAEVFVRVMLLPPSALYAGIGALRFMMSHWPRTPRTLHATRSLRWVFLAAWIALLIGSAIWLSTPNINYIPTTSTAVQAPDGGVIQEHRTWLAPLLGALLTSLLPFLRPKRLLESGLRPKNFWEPWLFRIACTAAVLGVPLVGIHLFGRHNVSGFNQFRGPELLAEDLDGIGFWERINKERQEDANGPSALLWKKLNEEPIKAGDPPLDQLFHDPTYARIFRQQPVPLSPRAQAAEQRLTDTLNRIAFSDQTIGTFKDKVFDKSIKEQQAIANDSTRAKAQWAKWPELKLLLDEVQKVPSNEYNKGIQKKNHGKINRLLLESQYPNEILNKSTIIRPVVVSSDQLFRVAAIAILAVLSLLTMSQIRLNITSLHWYYRDQLAAAYLGASSSPEAPGTKESRLSQLDTVSKGGPYLLINATLNVPSFRDLLLRSFGAPEPLAGGSCPVRARTAGAPACLEQSPSVCQPEFQLETELDQVPSGCTDAFLFSEMRCGSEYSGYQPTSEYENRGQKLRLRDAIALSGAAVSLTQIDNPLILLFMAMLNLRLGQWLPNPGRGGRMPPPSAWDLCRDSGGEDGRRHFFISDGGHHDNLGLGALLRRRCRVIFVSDATFDPNYTFADFRRVERRERRERGIRVIPADERDEEQDQPLSFDRLRPTVRASYSFGEVNEPKIERWFNLSHFLVARIAYPPGGLDEPDDGYLVYIKPSLTGDEPEDLKGHWAEHAEFPHDPTSNQFHGENVVESYRELGEHIGTRLWREVFYELHVDLWSAHLSTVPEVIEQYCARLPWHGPHDLNAPHAQQAAPAE